jgi:catechol 2,3-dioxygenase-like lactoylglutathione lyase family enzyme
MMVNCVGLIEIGVNDMDRARSFYCDLLGLAVRTADYLPRVLVLENDGPSIVLYLADQATSIAYPNQAQTLLAFQVDEIQQAMDELRAAGVELLHSEPETAPPGLFAAFRDPFGNVHDLFERQMEPGA